jgi:hypothetical protein
VLDEVLRSRPDAARLVHGGDEEYRVAVVGAVVLELSHRAVLVDYEVPGDARCEHGRVGRNVVEVGMRACLFIGGGLVAPSGDCVLVVAGDEAGDDNLRGRGERNEVDVEGVLCVSDVDELTAAVGELPCFGPGRERLSRELLALFVYEVEDCRASPHADDRQVRLGFRQSEVRGRVAFGSGHTVRQVHGVVQRMRPHVASQACVVEQRARAGLEVTPLSLNEAVVGVYVRSGEPLGGA